MQVVFRCFGDNAIGNALLSSGNTLIIANARWSDMGLNKRVLTYMLLSLQMLEMMGTSDMCELFQISEKTAPMVGLNVEMINGWSVKY